MTNKRTRASSQTLRQSHRASHRLAKSARRTWRMRRAFLDRVAEGTTQLGEQLAAQELLQARLREYEVKPSQEIG